MPIREVANACSEHLRAKTTKAVERGTGKKKSGAARTFGLSLSSVKRYVRMARRKGLSPKRRPGRRPVTTSRQAPLAGRP